MKLNRANFKPSDPKVAEKAPERIVHIGIGAFAKAHQVWFTHSVDPEKQWGVVAFTGRSAKAANDLNEQDGLYTLIERSAQADSLRVIDSIVRAEDISNVSELSETISNPGISIVTLTITESGYGYDSDGRIDVDNPSPALNKLAVALELRRRSNGAAITIVPCDNIPSNGELLGRAIREIFSTFSSESQSWLDSNVSFISTSVDRITPKTTQADIDLVAEHGWEDNSVTVTEPFCDWILSGDFIAGRPEWQNAGAKFVAEIEPFERRKLWLLNGAHSALAYSGILRGHATVAEAVADEFCQDMIERFWLEAGNHLASAELDIENYKSALRSRFSNTRIAHQLSQISIDGATKLALRVAPVALSELRTGNSAEACAEIIAAWINFLRSSNFQDSKSSLLKTALGDAESTQKIVALLDQDLAQDNEFVALVASKTLQLIF